MSKAALDGVKVVELCNFVAGPYCAKLMADLGAEVIKVEEPRCGDEARRRGPFAGDTPHLERSLLFLYLNTNKFGVTLSLNSGKGKKLFEELVVQADILVEDNPPQAMDKLGLGYDALKKLNPKLIMTSITPFGQSGPYRDYKAYYLNLFHGGGEGHLTPAGDPYPGRPPLKIGRFAGEYEIGIHSAVATMAALYWQRLTGVGQWVDISKQEALMAVSALQLAMMYLGIGHLPVRSEGGFVVGGSLPCKDGWVQISLYNESNWQGLVDLMGNPEWSRDERYKDAGSRARHSKELNSLISESLVQLTKDHIYHQGQKLGVPVGCYFTTEDIFNSGQEKSRGFFAPLDHPEAGRLDYPTAPYKFSETPWRGGRAAPLLGENNEEVYHHRLGYSKQELASMRGLGII